MGSPRGYPSPYSQYVVLETQGPPVPGCTPSRLSQGLCCVFADLSLEPGVDAWV